jgi:hypothetical protein
LRTSSSSSSFFLRFFQCSFGFFLRFPQPPHWPPFTPFTPPSTIVAATNTAAADFLWLIAHAAKHFIVKH